MSFAKELSAHLAGDFVNTAQQQIHAIEAKCSFDIAKEIRRSISMCQSTSVLLLASAQSIEDAGRGTGLTPHEAQLLNELVIAKDCIDEVNRLLTNVITKEQQP